MGSTLHPVWGSQKELLWLPSWQLLLRKWLCGAPRERWGHGVSLWVGGRMLALGVMVPCCLALCIWPADPPDVCFAASSLHQLVCVWVDGGMISSAHGLLPIFSGGCIWSWAR